MLLKEMKIDWLTKSISVSRCEYVPKSSTRWQGPFALRIGSLFDK